MKVLYGRACLAALLSLLVMMGADACGGGQDSAAPNTPPPTTGRLAAGGGGASAPPTSGGPSSRGTGPKAGAAPGRTSSRAPRGGKAEPGWSHDSKLNDCLRKHGIPVPVPDSVTSQQLQAAIAACRKG